MTTNTTPAAYALVELSEEEQEAVAGGRGSQRLNCDLWGNAAQSVSAAVGGAMTQMPHPIAKGLGLGLVAGAGPIGSMAKEICNTSYERNVPTGSGGGGGRGGAGVPDIDAY